MKGDEDGQEEGQPEKFSKNFDLNTRIIVGIYNPKKMQVEKKNIYQACYITSLFEAAKRIKNAERMTQEQPGWFEMMLCLQIALCVYWLSCAQM